MDVYRAEHQISDANLDDHKAVTEARGRAYRDALRKARAERGTALPSDHGIDEAIRPDGAGGFIVEVILRVP